MVMCVGACDVGCGGSGYVLVSMCLLLLLRLHIFREQFSTLPLIQQLQLLPDRASVFLKHACVLLRVFHVLRP